MAIWDEIRQALITAMKARDELKLQTARMAQSALKNQEIDKKAPLTDAEVEKILMTMVKQRRESETQFREAGREDLAEKERLEREFLQTFLPEPLDAATLQKEVQAAITEIGASSLKDMGLVMKAVMPKVGNRAEGKDVKESVQSALKEIESAN